MSRVITARRAQQLLAVIKEQPGITTSELVTNTGITRPTIYHALSMLQDDGKITKGAKRSWHPGRASRHVDTKVQNESPKEDTTPIAQDVRKLPRRSSWPQTRVSLERLPIEVIKDPDFVRALRRYIDD